MKVWTPENTALIGKPARVILWGKPVADCERVWQIGKLLVCRFLRRDASGKPVKSLDGEEFARGYAIGFGRLEFMA